MALPTLIDPQGPKAQLVPQFLIAVLKVVWTAEG